MNTTAYRIKRPSLKPYLQTSTPTCSVYDNRIHVSRVFPKKKQSEINKTNRKLKENLEAIATRHITFHTLYGGPAAKGSAAIDLATRTRHINRENKKLAARLRNVKSTIGKWTENHPRSYRRFLSLNLLAHSLRYKIIIGTIFWVIWYCFRYAEWAIIYGTGRVLLPS